MLKKFQYFSLLFFINAIVFFIPSVSLVMGTESEAISRISHAEYSLEVAYLSVLKAERVGADVSDLVSLLNTALDYFSEAERALEYGEYETATLLASKTVETSNLVLEVDITLLVTAENVEEEVLKNRLFLTFGEVFFIIMFGFLGWRQFKGYYFRRVISLRPEAVADES
ncbi:MAG: hypothetical protein ACFFDT_26125 [Candidatus Hodarchaeota archaeon]